MKRSILIILALILVASTCVLFACSSGGDNAPSSYIVSFNTGGGTPVKSITVKNGETITLPEPPVKEGFVFIGWYFDNNFEREVNASVFRAVSNVTIFAGWESVETYRHPITVSNYPFGKIKVTDPEDSRASMGTEVSVVVNPAQGYELVEDTLRANGVLVTSLGGNSYTFTMPAEPVTLTAEFDLIPMSVSTPNLLNNGGSVILSTDKARRGELVTVQVVPDYGYRVIDLYLFNNGQQGVEGGKTSILSTCSFYMSSNPAIVGATFEKINYDLHYDVTVDAQEGGTVTPSVNSSAAGLFVDLDITVDDGYRLQSYTVAGQDSEVTMKNADGFVMPDYDVVVKANFIKISEDDEQYELSISPSQNGEVTLQNPKNHYKAGEKVEINVLPDKGYAVKSLYVNGVNVVGDCFAMPEEDATITVEFVKKGYDIGVVSSHCEVVVSAITAYEGEIIYFTVIPDEGFAVSPSNLTLNGEPLTGTYFVMPDKEVVINAIAYSASTAYNVNVANIANGTLEVSQSFATIYSKITITPCPDAGYRMVDGSLSATYMLDGEEKTAQLKSNEFNMPSSDVVLSALFEKVYTINAYDNGIVGVYPSVNEIAVGDNVLFDVVAHGDVISETVEIQINYGSCSEDLDDSFVFELTESKKFDAGSFDSIDVRVTSYNNFDNLNFYPITVITTDGGSISVPGRDSAQYGALVNLEVSPDEGYTLESIILSTNNGDSYVVSESFRMPKNAIRLTPTFRRIDEVPFGLGSAYTNNLQSLKNAGFKVKYYRQKYQMLDDYPTLKASKFIDYVVGAVAVDAKYGHDFYIVEVNDISRVNSIAEKLHDFIATISNVDKQVINVKIKYNYVILSIGGNPEEDYLLYRNGVNTINDFILYLREDRTYGVFAYVGNSDYVAIPESYRARDVSYLGSNAFKNPIAIKGVSLGNVKVIEDYALANTSIKHVDVSNATHIGLGVFKGCYKLETITAMSSNSTYFTYNGVLYQKGASNYTTLLCFPASKVAINDAYNLPSGCREIADYAFYGSVIKTVSYGGQLAKIGDYAFAECRNLVSIKYFAANAVTGFADFSVNTANKSVVSHIGEGAFMGCEKLNSFSLDSVTYLGKNAICWDGNSPMNVTLNSQIEKVVEVYAMPIEVAENAESTLRITISSNLKALYEAHDVWGKYSEYFIIS